MRRAGLSRSDLTRKIWHYQQKRAELKELGYTSRDPKYLRVQAKLNTWMRAVRNIDGTMDKIKEFNQNIKYAYDISMSKSIHWQIKSTDKLLIRKMFCKYLIEQGILSRYISQFIGWKTLQQANRERTELNKLIKVDEVAMQKWRYFKKRMERQLPKQQRA